MNRIILALIAVVLIAIAGFALLWFRVGGDLQERAEAILIDCRDGRRQAVYEKAAEGLRSGRTLPQFSAYLDYWHARRGAFVKVLERTGVSTSSGDGVSRKAVNLRLEYERGELDARVAFDTEGEEPRLLHLSLREPAPEDRRGDVEPLVAASRALLEHYNERAYVALYAALSPELQMSWPPETLQAQLAGIHVKAGRVDTQVDPHELTDDGEVRTIVYQLQFERTPGTATVGFRWDDDHWRIVTFVLKLGA